MIKSFRDDDHRMSATCHSDKDILHIYLQPEGIVQAYNRDIYIDGAYAITIHEYINGIKPHKWKSTSGRHEII